MLASYTAIDFALNISGITSMGAKWIPLITFIVFALVIFWIIYDLKKANEHLLDSRPTINVEPLKEGEVLYLKVHNKGAEGKFSMFCRS